MRRIHLLIIAFIAFTSIAVFLSQNSSQLKPFILGTSTGLADSPWPMFHGGPRHGGQSLIDTSHVDGTLLWTFEVDGNAEAPPSIGADGTIYVGTHGNSLYAINPDGTEKWKFNVGKPVYSPEFGDSKGVLSTPAVARDGTIYFSSISDYFFAINPDGTEKWRVKLAFTADVWTSPLIGPDGTIYTGSARSFDEEFEGMSGINIGGMHAFNPDGTLKWEIAYGADMGASPVIAEDGTVYGSSYNIIRGRPTGWIVAANPDGTEKWRFEFDRFTESSPTIGKDGTIHVGTVTGMIYAINPDGSEKWRFETNDGVSAAPAIGADGTVYVGSWDSNFFAINPDGSEKWRFKTPDTFEALSSSPAIGAEGTIYVGSGQPKIDDDNFFAFNPDGTVKWSYSTKGGISSSPAIGSDGTVYIASHNGGLYAFGGSGEKTIPAGLNKVVSKPLSFASSKTQYLVVGLVAAVIIGGAVVFIKKRS
jgi:outer membrane protein assembly factor BamB